MSLYNVEAARTPEQLEKMRQLEDEGICVFCLEYFAQYHTEPICMDGQYWYVTKNDYPYQGALVHLLIVAKEHVTAITEMPTEAGSELFAMLATLRQAHQASSEAIVARSGDMRFNAGSVEHLHIHYVIGNPALAESSPVRFKLSSAPKNN
ncbi:MAG TPA: HIT domain-containing protein [Candidatus Dormibacteraeota bacterium]|nr:HIT domain-containing protein [Candidatus Dormibacteraeota bacterium]